MWWWRRYSFHSSAHHECWYPKWTNEEWARTICKSTCLPTEPDQEAQVYCHPKTENLMKRTSANTYCVFLLVCEAMLCGWVGGSASLLHIFAHVHLRSQRAWSGLATLVISNLVSSCLSFSDALFDMRALLSWLQSHWNSQRIYWSKLLWTMFASKHSPFLSSSVFLLSNFFLVYLLHSCFFTPVFCHYPQTYHDTCKKNRTASCRAQFRPVRSMFNEVG